jgi:glutamate dehydrogenase (NADP+)
VSLSDSSGCVHDPEGIDADKLAWVTELVSERRGRIREYAEHFGVDYHEGGKPWSIPCDLALPCATQNELDESDADALIEHGCLAVVEGANMPATTAAIARLRAAKLLFGPGKAANAGGVATSGLEMAQNSQRMVWSRERVDTELQAIMDKIHAACCEEGRMEDGRIDYAVGANVAAFKKVGDAVLDQGV